MKSFSNLVEKLLKSEEYIIDGFKYEIINVEESKDFEGALEFTFNVTLPDPESSYCLTKFNMDIEDKILERLFSILNKQFSVRYQVLVDMKEPKEVYIRPKTVLKIIDTIKEKYSRATLIRKDTKLELEIDINPGKGIPFYNSELSDEIEFNFSLDITRILKNGVEINPTDEQIEPFRQWFHDALSDDDNYRIQMENDVYFIINPEMKIMDVEIFISCYLAIKEIDGRSVKPFGNYIPNLQLPI